MPIHTHLLKFKDNEELNLLLVDIEAALKDFMVKAKISEFLSLMTMELAAMAENTNIQTFSKNRYKGTASSVAIECQLAWASEGKRGPKRKTVLVSPSTRQAP